MESRLAITLTHLRHLSTPPPTFYDITRDPLGKRTQEHPSRTNLVFQYHIRYFYVNRHRTNLTTIIWPTIPTRNNATLETRPRR
jgi:hypothetical protein